MAKPGIVLKRPVGSNGPFGEHAGLPTGLGRGGKPSVTARKPPARKSKAVRPADKAAERKAALAYEREEKRRDRERARHEAAAKREKERRQAAIDKAQSDLDAAEREHAEKAAAIDAEREAVEKKSRTEDARWEKERDRLSAALKRARD
jgi:flagellar motility protein MotE (MotC chaperone)